MSSKYKTWKEWAHGRPRFWVECGERFIGYAASQKGAELLIEADRVGEAMYSAPLESRSKPKMFKGVAID
jgi:hypothetical protein